MSEYRDDLRPVEKVRIVVHTTGPWLNGTMSDNHWSVYLLLREDAGSVRMNMTAELDDPKGGLVWTSLIYSLTNSAIKNWDYKAVNGIQVAHICRLIEEKGRDNYDMSGGGSGCRWWVYIVIKDLETKGFLALKTAGNELYPNLLFQYSKTGPKKELAMVKGTFTARSTTAALTSSSASAAAPSPSKPVQVKSYTSNGRLCYSWTLNNQEDRSYADNWTSITGRNGKPGLLHKGKNLVSALPQ
ncbi:hypothetical protein MMC27_007011 [Xylographa pallens]|nr:hypothetical protein [Xylographa pallens]